MFCAQPKITEQCPVWRLCASWMFNDNYSNSYPPMFHPLYFIIIAINHYLSCPQSRPRVLPTPISATLTFYSSTLQQPSQYEILGRITLLGFNHHLDHLPMSRTLLFFNSRNIFEL